jgi:hypothetical protein
LLQQAGHRHSGTKEPSSDGRRLRRHPHLLRRVSLALVSGGVSPQAMQRGLSIGALLGW